MLKSIAKEKKCGDSVKSSLFHVLPWLPSLLYFLGICVQNTRYGTAIFLYVLSIFIVIINIICAVLLARQGKWNQIIPKIAGIFLIFLLRAVSLNIYIGLYVFRIMINGAHFQQCIDSAQQITKHERVGLCGFYETVGFDYSTDLIIYDETGEINQTEQSAEWIAAVTNKSIFFTTQGYSVHPLIKNFYLIEFFLQRETDNNLVQKYNIYHYSL